MNRTGLSISVSARRADVLPRSASGSSRVLRAVTSAYSAATKIALPRISAKIAAIRAASLMPTLHFDVAGGGARRPRSEPGRRY